MGFVDELAARDRLGVDDLSHRNTPEHHGPAGARTYRYVPTFILRGLTRLHIRFTPAGA